jgi:hypothetical protein
VKAARGVPALSKAGPFYGADDPVEARGPGRTCAGPQAAWFGLEVEAGREPSWSGARWINPTTSPGSRSVMGST